MGKLSVTEHSSKTKCSKSEGNIPVLKQMDEVVLAIHRLISRLELKLALMSCFSEQWKTADETFLKGSIGNISAFAFAILLLYEVRVKKILLILSKIPEEFSLFPWVLLLTKYG